jgi:hypothetical protein
MPEKIAKGERQGSSKLTEQDALEIRRLYRENIYNQSALGRIFGVGQVQIGRIVRRKQWKHIS